MIKRSTRITALIALILMLGLIGSAAAQETVLNGYEKKNGYQYVQFGTYPYEADGTKAPILWRVLTADSGKAYILTEYIVDFYYTHWDSNKYYDMKNWNNSDLYQYLQNDFTARAFTEGEKDALIRDIEDGSLVAVLHVEEARNAAYGFAENRDRLCKGTPYAKNYTLQVNTGTKIRNYNLYTYKDGNSPWFLREKSTDSHSMQREILNEGKFGKVGCTNADVGIRPCAWIDLSKLVIEGGNGTKDDPYQLKAANEPAAAGTPQPVENKTTEAPAATPAETPAPAVTETPAVITEATAEPTAEPAKSEGGKTVFTAAADPATIHPLFPALTEEGFLPAGEPEFVLEDEENGLWLYCSQTLRVEITRKTGSVIHEKKEKVIRWYEAQIYTRDNSEVFDLYALNEEKYTNIYTLALAEDMAKQHKLVFSLNSDYFIYRVTRDKEESYVYPIGTEIRDGNVMYTQTRNSKSYVYPPLDVLALYPDGDMRVFPNKLLYDSDYKHASVEFDGVTYSYQTTKGIKLNGRQQAENAMAEMILASGATDTLCFGPILIQNGQKADTGEWGTSLNPRTAIGMVEPGHYVSVVVEGRLGSKGISYGTDCAWLVEKMAELNCEIAFNLDGGATTAMMFMGKQISVSGDYGNGLNERKQNELLGIGHYMSDMN